MSRPLTVSGVARSDRLRIENAQIACCPCAEVLIASGSARSPWGFPTTVRFRAAEFGPSLAQPGPDAISAIGVDTGVFASTRTVSTLAVAAATTPAQMPTAQ